MIALLGRIRAQFTIQYTSLRATVYSLLGHRFQRLMSIVLAVFGFIGLAETSANNCQSVVEWTYLVLGVEGASSGYCPDIVEEGRT